MTQQKILYPEHAGLYEAFDPDKRELYPYIVGDIQVDNMNNYVGGGLQAHNYWDNKPEFIKPLAKILKNLVESELINHETEQAPTV